MKSVFVGRIRPRSKLIAGTPDLLPFVSVFFLMLMFFMLCSTFVPVSGIPVNLPEAPSVGVYSMKKFVVTLDKDDALYFNDQPVDDINQLKGKLLSDVARVTGERAAIVLRADKNCSFETFTRIMALADELKISVFVLTQAPSPSQQTIFTDTEK